MNADRSALFPKASRQKTKADIVFCIDVTGSMQPCIDAIKENIVVFLNGLHSAAAVDYRLRLIAFRDRHDTQVYGAGKRACDEPWFVSEFTSKHVEFIQWMNQKDVQAYGGGDDPESALDAIYLAISASEWRPTAHRSIILFTDDDSHPELHESTYKYPDRGVERVIQAFQTLPHALLFMVVPQFTVYERLEGAMTDACRKVIARYVPYHKGNEEAPYYGLRELDWGKYLGFIGQTVSQTSIQVLGRL